MIFISVTITYLFFIQFAVKNGLKKTEVSLDINSVKELISSYTREAGVRQLEREIENGDWLLQSLKTDLLFNLTAKKIWGNAIESLGIYIIDISNVSGSA